jgi:ketosteroid isomerase-like protein
MSRETLEIVRAIHELLARGESPATLDLLHPDIEYVNPAGAVEPGTRRGIAAYENALRSIHDSFDDVRIEVREIKDVGEQVVVLATYTARGRRSGAERHNEDAYVWTIRDGKATRFEWFNEPAKALEALGLDGAPSSEIGEAPAAE